MKEDEQKFWEEGDKAFYQKMLDRHPKLWSWVQETIEDGIRSVIEIGGSYSPIPKWLPANGFYLNIDINDGPPVPFANSGNMVADFRDVDPETLPECDLLIALAVVEHCKHYSEFFEWALKTKAKRIVVSFFNRLINSVDIIRMKGPLFYNHYNKKGLETWLADRGLVYELSDLGNDDIADVWISSKQYNRAFESRIDLANKLEVQVRHDEEQLSALFAEFLAIGPKKMIEIGSFRGGTALVFGGMGLRQMLLVDMCDRKKARPFLDKSIEHLRAEGIDVTLFEGDSACAAADGAAAEFGMVDNLYIDGSHKTRMVIHDYMMFRKYVKNGGLIGFHDVARPKLVKRAWELMKQAWDKQGLVYRIVGGDEWNRQTRPWATGIGVLEWKRSALADSENEKHLLQIALDEEQSKL